MDIICTKSWLNKMQAKKKSKITEKTLTNMETAPMIGNMELISTETLTVHGVL